MTFQSFNLRNVSVNEMNVGQTALEILKEESKDFTEENMLAVLEKLENDHSLNETMRKAAGQLKDATRDVFKISKWKTLEY